MEQKFIDSHELSRVIKDYFKALISKGYSVADIHDLNADLHKMMAMLPGAAAIEWCDTERELPVVSDEYIVMVAYADKPTVLHYDADEQVFFHEVEGEVVLYKVTHWAEMPNRPEQK